MSTCRMRSASMQRTTCSLHLSDYVLVALTYEVNKTWNFVSLWNMEVYLNIIIIFWEERERLDRQTDRQSDRQAIWQAGRQADRQTENRNRPESLGGGEREREAGRQWTGTCQRGEKQKCVWTAMAHTGRTSCCLNWTKSDDWEPRSSPGLYSRMLSAHHMAMSQWLHWHPPLLDHSKENKPANQKCIQNELWGSDSWVVDKEAK